MDQDNKISLYESQPALETRRVQGQRSFVLDEGREIPRLIEYWRVISKRRGTILTVLFIVFAIVLIATLKQKPVYEAHGLIEIQKENPDIPTLQELFQVESVSDTYLETQDRILRSENLARRVITRLHLDQLPEFRPSHHWSSFWPKAAPVSQEYPQGAAAATDTSTSIGQNISDDVLEKFEDKLSVEPVRRSRLIEVSFDSNDPKLAAAVVNELTSAYIEENLEARWNASQKAAEWLSQQLQDMKAKLEKSEDQLQQYAQDNGLLFLETDKGTTENIVVQRLRELQDELTKAQAERYEKESLYRLVQQGDGSALPGIFDDKLMQDLAEKLDGLKQERARLDSTFNPDYPRVKEVQSQIDEASVSLAAERARVADIVSNDYRAAAEHENMLQDAFDQQEKQANEVAEKSVQYNILKRETDTNKQLYVGLLEKMKETGVSTSLKATNIRVVDTAYPPRKPDRPRILLNLSVGLLLGLGLGIGAAFLQDHLDNTFKSAEEVERFLQLPALGSVPAMAISNNHNGVHGFYQRARILAGDKQKLLLPSQWNRIEGDGQNVALSEAFHGLRTSVLLSTAKRPPSSLLVTSAQAGEGKTTVAANLALSLSQLGESVLLVDADLRRPSIHNFFGMNNSAGLVNYLTGHSDWRSVVWQAAPTALSVLFSGPVPPNPADLLSSEYMRSLLREASREYKFVVLDSPPVLNLADSRILATLVDGVILVIGSGSTPRELVHRAYTSAIDAGSHVLGAAINFADTKSGYYYSSYEAKDEVHS